MKNLNVNLSHNILSHIVLRLLQVLISFQLILTLFDILFIMMKENYSKIKNKRNPLIVVYQCLQIIELIIMHSMLIVIFF
jgi:hypothetical protein